MLDLLFVFDAYEAVSNQLTPNLRRLTPLEHDRLYDIFGDSVPYDRIRLDERAYVGPRCHPICYVSFHTINSWGPIPLAILVHEVMHVWQYVHHGACYIPRALAGQRTVAGYDYGGQAGLTATRHIRHFNYEQQASVVEDAYRLSRGLPTRYLHGVGKAEGQSLLQPFVQQLRRRRLPVAYIHTDRRKHSGT
ncbi:hypothetical protein [Neolewinella sp.]|uniref:hypothetical protein n=1 Tax=Neolewinella sp. TaxID=2993543 RepID=UPI003B51BEA7